MGGHVLGELSAAEPEEVKKDMDDFFDEEEKNAPPAPEGEPDAPKPSSGGKSKPSDVNKDDVDKARSGSAEAQAEYEKIQKGGKIDPELASWNPVTTITPAETYRDRAFIDKMNVALRDWKKGYKTVVGERGARLSIPDYIKHQDTPFATRIKSSAKGKKLLVIADFSASMKDREDDYKKALVSSSEVLSSIGCNVAMFGFGGDPSTGDGFFVVKNFEEHKWQPKHSNRLSSIQATYGTTPLYQAYGMLAKYIQRHRPAATITVTDGSPNGPNTSTVRATELTARVVKELRKNTKMVAFGLGDSSLMSPMLKGLGYNESFVVDEVNKIPSKLIKTVTG